MEQKIIFSLKPAVMAIALLLGLVALGDLFDPQAKVQAETARFDHVQIVSTTFIHKGQMGLLLLDRRFKDPVFLVRVPVEKLDQAP